MNLLLKKLDIVTPSTQAKSTLLGACLFNLGSGGILAWSSINVYFFSYFYHFDENFSVKYAQMAFGFAFLLVGVAALFAVNIAQKLGFENLIRTCSILYIISVLCSSFATKYIQFFIFYNFLASTAYCMAAIPILNCAWSQFDKKDSGKITGMCLFCLSFSTLVILFLFTFLINPNNIPSSITQKEGGLEVRFFDKEISEQVPGAILKMSLFYSFLILPGAFKIHKRVQVQEYQEFDKEDKNSAETGQTKSQIISGPQNLKEVKIPKEQQQQLEQRQLSNGSNGSNGIGQEPQILIAEEKSVKECLFTLPFMVLYTYNLIDAMYIGYLQINFKVYGQNKINDDQFLTSILLFNQIIGGFSNLLFGYLIDKLHFKYCFFLIQSVIGFLVFTMPFIATFKIMLFLWYVTIGFALNGLQTIMGPVLMGIFGVDLGSKLLSVKSTGFFSGVILIQVFGFLLNLVFSFDSVLHMLGIVIFVSAFLIKKISHINIHN